MCLLDACIFGKCRRTYLRVEFSSPHIAPARVLYAVRQPPGEQADSGVYHWSVLGMLLLYTCDASPPGSMHDFTTGTCNSGICHSVLVRCPLRHPFGLLTVAMTKAGTDDFREAACKLCDRFGWPRL